MDEKKTVRTPEIIQKVKVRFDRNPQCSCRKIARELIIPRERMQRILKTELGLKPLKFQKVQGLIDAQQKVRLERAIEILRLHESGQLPILDFSELKPFQIEQLVNKQKRPAENLQLRSATTSATDGRLYSSNIGSK